MSDIYQKIIEDAERDSADSFGITAGSATFTGALTITQDPVIVGIKTAIDYILPWAAILLLAVQLAKLRADLARIAREGK